MCEFQEPLRGVFSLGRDRPGPPPPPPPPRPSRTERLLVSVATDLLAEEVGLVTGGSPRRLGRVLNCEELKEGREYYNV